MEKADILLGVLFKPAPQTSKFNEAKGRGSWLIQDVHLQHLFVESHKRLLDDMFWTEDNRSWLDPKPRLH